ncbi:MAG TPA: hypothetical protein VK012_06150 [Gemmatimonadales bacterium]|nr:hypothetical protein [Gemmatimonadales bacterium]
MLEVQLDDTIGVVGLCRILRDAEAVALKAWQSRSVVHVLLRLRETPESLDALEVPRAGVSQLPGIRRAALVQVPRLLWR